MRTCQGLGWRGLPLARHTDPNWASPAGVPVPSCSGEEMGPGKKGKKAGGARKERKERIQAGLRPNISASGSGRQGQVGSQRAAPLEQEVGLRPWRP